MSPALGQGPVQPQQAQGKGGFFSNPHCSFTERSKNSHTSPTAQDPSACSLECCAHPSAIPRGSACNTVHPGHSLINRLPLAGRQ